MQSTSNRRILNNDQNLIFRVNKDYSNRILAKNNIRTDILKDEQSLRIHLDVLKILNVNKISKKNSQSDGKFLKKKKGFLESKEHEVKFTSSNMVTSPSIQGNMIDQKNYQENEKSNAIFNNAALNYMNSIILNDFFNFLISIFNGLPQ